MQLRNKWKDENREKYLQGQGFAVVRYLNNTCLFELENVLEDLNKKQIQKDLPPTRALLQTFVATFAASTPPYKGGTFLRNLKIILRKD
ncbi:MAG: DUF559 domain-containing protein [Deltaproteobacteria bacterium]|nr:DUF559 domain-containing protein [Deltaproteobacteria bacterium]